jgi:phosphate transport system substrate-binding protein
MSVISRRRLLIAGASLAAAGCDGDAPPPTPTSAPAFAPEPTILRLLGTGALTPLAGRLSRAFNRDAGGELTVIVEPSVGSGGGIRAAQDGAVDIGLSSRALTAVEQEFRLDQIMVATGVVALGAHPSLDLEDLSSADLIALYRGANPALGPSAVRPTVLLRDREESANLALERVVPALHEPREDAYRSRRFRVIFHESAMSEALSTTPDSIGVIDLGAAFGSRLKVLSIDGVLPSLDAVRAGRWKGTRPLRFVMRPDRRERARAFLDFVRSPRGRDIMVSQGALPEGS